MKKKLFSIILVLCMAVSCAGFAAAEEAAAPGPLTSEELTTWAGELKDAALGTAPANDPAAEESEVEAARARGAEPITLGRRILRTETAGLAVLAALMFALEGKEPG